MTNQEKMQKIYEATGMEPKWLNASGGMLIEYCKEDYESDPVELRLPVHYPAEQLWGMLSNVIRFKGFKHELEAFDTASGPCVMYTDSFNVLHCTSEELGDLLTALLDMTIWCIENGIDAAERSEVKEKK